MFDLALKYKVLMPILALGCTLLFASSKMDPYKDPEKFRTEYSKMKSGDSEKYFKLRDELVSSKYAYMDHGISLIMVAFLLLIAKYSRLFSHAPKTRIGLVILGIFLPFLTVVGYAFDLIQGESRQEFPHWADSLGIPLMGVPVMLLFLLVLALAMYGHVHKDFLPRTSLRLAFKKDGEKGHFVLAGPAGLVAFCSFVYGQYWYWLPAAGWAYYFLSLGSIQKREV
jgi:hypothetical protein